MAMTERERVLRVDRIRERMEALDLDQTRLGERSGLTGGAVSRLLNSGSCVVSSLRAICGALDCSADYLIGLAETPNSTFGSGKAMVPDEVSRLWHSLDESAHQQAVDFLRFKVQQSSFPAVDERATRTSRWLSPKRPASLAGSAALAR